MDMTFTPVDSGSRLRYVTHKIYELVAQIEQEEQQGDRVRPKQYVDRIEAILVRELNKS